MPHCLPSPLHSRRREHRHHVLLRPHGFSLETVEDQLHLLAWQYEAAVARLERLTVSFLVLAVGGRVSPEHAPTRLLFLQNNMQMYHSPPSFVAA